MHLVIRAEEMQETEGTLGERIRRVRKERAYLRARELQPGLPGLEHNLARLRKEFSMGEQSESKEQDQ